MFTHSRRIILCSSCSRRYISGSPWRVPYDHVWSIILGVIVSTVIDVDSVHLVCLWCHCFYGLSVVSRMFLIFLSLVSANYRRNRCLFEGRKGCHRCPHTRLHRNPSSGIFPQDFWHRNSVNRRTERNPKYRIALGSCISVVAVCFSRCRITTGVTDYMFLVIAQLKLP